MLRYASPQRSDAYAGIHPTLLYDLDKDGWIDIVAVRSARQRIRSRLWPPTCQ